MMPNIFFGHERFSPCTLTRVSFRGGGGGAKGGDCPPLDFLCPPLDSLCMPSLEVMGLKYEMVYPFMVNWLH